MHLRFTTDGGFTSLTFCQTVPKCLSGIHENTRTKSFAGVANLAVDLLLVHRFEIDIEELTVAFHELVPCLEVSKFLDAGGFDESIVDVDECVEEFLLRLFESMSDGLNYSRQFKKILSNPMSKPLQEKMLIRQGVVPEKPPLNENLPFVEKRTFRGGHGLHGLTLCVTFGDETLVDQFLQSLSSAFSDEVNIDLVACCFSITSEAVLNRLKPYEYMFQTIKVLPEEWGHQQALDGKLGPWYIDQNYRCGVAWGRCVLHRASALFSPNEAMWIVDDDVEFHSDSITQCLMAFNTMKKSNLKVGIGAIVGDAPIPPSYMVRTQVIDFFYRRFIKKNQHQTALTFSRTFHDMHHDLSTTRTDHLEFPYGLETALRYKRLDLGVFHGQSITRAAHSEWRVQKRTLPRGGNTLVLGKGPLLNYPNMAPLLGGIMCRRGDTLWSKRIETDTPESIGNVNMALHQRRQGDFGFGRLEEVRGDILGSMLVRFHEQETMSTQDLMNLVRQREARLLSNLKRVVNLLKLMKVNGHEHGAVIRLLSQLETTPWPVGMRDDIDRFVKDYPPAVSKFRQAQGA